MLENCTIICLFINIVLLIFVFILCKKKFKSFVYISIPFVFFVLIIYFYLFTHCYIFYLDYTTEYYGKIKEESICTSLIFITFCNIAFTLGTYFSQFFKTYKTNFSKYIKTYNVNKLFQIALILLFIGIITKLVVFTINGKGNIIHFITHYFAIAKSKASGGGSFFEYLRIPAACLPLGTNLLLIYYLKTKKQLLLLCSMTALTVLLLFTGRMTIISFLFQYMAIICIFSSKIRKLIPLYFVFIVLPIILTLVIGLGLFRETTAGIDINDKQLDYFFVGSNHGMRGIATVINEPRLFTDRSYGFSIIAPIAFKLIPRTIWKNKPLNTAAIYTEKIEPGALSSGGAIAPGIHTDLFLNFDYIGSVIFFFLLGIVMMKLQKVLLNYIIYKPNSDFYVLLMAYLVSFCLYLRGEDITLIITYSGYSIIPLCLTFLRIRVK